jgi:uncharacterized membrane protein YphA (DoxX/SURF4 family)
VRAGERHAWLAIGLAWALALLHAAAALGKVLDLPGFVEVASAYRLLPRTLLWPSAIGVMVAEAAIALGLLLPRWRRASALAAGLMALIYGAALSLTLLRGISLENCGCFGVYLARPLTILSPLEDLVIVALALLLLRLTPARALPA